MNLQYFIKKYLQNYSLEKISTYTDVSISTIREVLNNNSNRKFSAKILDNLYRFFDLEKDEFYFSRIRLEKYSNHPLWNFFKQKRLKLGFSLAKVGKIIKMSERHIARIEEGKINFNPELYSVQKLMELYKISKTEKENVILYYIAEQKMKKMLKNPLK